MTTPIRQMQVAKRALVVATLGLAVMLGLAVKLGLVVMLGLVVKQALGATLAPVVCLAMPARTSVGSADKDNCVKLANAEFEPRAGSEIKPVVCQTINAWMQTKTASAMR